jgi:hypothetical protein
VKTLFTNGCSWTWGGALDLPDTIEHLSHLHDHIVWPAQLKKIMGYDNVVNLSQGCGSNQRICRTTFDWVTTQTPETLKNTVAVIQWSLVDRYEYYVPHSNDSRFTERKATLDDLENIMHFTEEEAKIRYSLQENNLSRWANVSPSSFISYYENHLNDHAQKVAHDRYRTYTDIEGVYIWLNQLGFLHDLFTSHNVEYYYWFFCNEVFAYPQHIQDYMYERFNFLEPNRQHFWNYERIYDIEDTDDSHPTARGHQQLAEYIYEAIAKTKTNLRNP